MVKDTLSASELAAHGLEVMPDGTMRRHGKILNAVLDKANDKLIFLKIMDIPGTLKMCVAESVALDKSTGGTAGCH